MLREGRPPRPVARIEDIPSLRLSDRLGKVSAWSLATLAALAAVCALYLARELMLPIVAAFVVGVMLSPLARRLEALRVPRAIVALLIVLGVALLIGLVIALVVPRVSELTTGLPALVASLKEKLQVFDGLIRFWHRLSSTVKLQELLRRATPSPCQCPGSIGSRRHSAFCCRLSPDFFSFSWCCFCSSQNGRTCAADSS